MKELLKLHEWHQRGIRAAMATVVQTWGSSPRPVGSLMAVSESGEVVGSVSGGCVESEVVFSAQEAIESRTAKFLDFKQISSEEVWKAGLSCGGRIEVFVEPSPFETGDSHRLQIWQTAASQVQNNAEARVIRNLSSGNNYGSKAQIPATLLTEEVEQLFASEKSLAVEGNGKLWFALVNPAPIQLIVVGASHIAIPLFRMAQILNFSTVLIEPRASLASEARFEVPPQKIYTDWPQTVLPNLQTHARSCLVTLSHDEKIDMPALEFALKGNFGYVGALGSKSTQAQRREAFRQMGFLEADLDRIHGPIGLAIGAKTPEEIALSIIAEIVRTFRIGS